MIKKLRITILLHILLMGYSLSGICSKLAAREDFLSVKFCVYYSLIILLLGIYAIGWQQIIKRMPLTTAFSNKAVTIVWGIVWGMLFFHEKITAGNIIGAVMVLIGIVLYTQSDEKESVNG